MLTEANIASRPIGQALQTARTEKKADPGSDSSFGQITESFLEIMQKGEQTAKAGLLGRADPLSVVEALSTAEVAFQTIVTLRDKVVEAYQEILRMPV